LLHFYGFWRAIGRDFASEVNVIASEAKQSLRLLRPTFGRPRNDG
jgi:hypothetical protein